LQLISAFAPPRIDSGGAADGYPALTVPKCLPGSGHSLLAVPFDFWTGYFDTLVRSAIAFGDRHKQSGGYTMERKFVLFASAWVLLIGSAFAAESAPNSTLAIEKAIAARSMAFARAALQGDLATFSTFMSDDYVMLWAEPAADGKKPHWATKTKEEWVEELRSRKNKYRSVELQNTKVYLHGNVAIFTGDYTQSGTREGVEYSEAGLFTETWVKRNGQWVIVGSVFP
jgi:ketosteroid isomerase-like protein